MDADGNLWGSSDVPLRTFLTDNADVVTGGVSGLLLLFLFFVIGGAYFGGAESGFSAMNKIRIKSKADDGDRRAKNANFISNNFDRALTTLLIGNNVTHIAAASIATVIATRLFGTSDTVAFYCTIITTLIVFLFSEMIPKSFANDRSETTALLCAGSLRMFMKVLSPLASFFTYISSLFTNLISSFIKQNEEPSITEEELYDIIETIEEEGVLDEEQGDLFKSALDFSDISAKDIMTMREDICLIDASLSNEEILEILQESKHSRFPICDGDIDHIIGILQLRVFIKEYLDNPSLDLRSILMEPYRTSPTAKIDDLLTEMRERKFYLSIVTDEEGKTLGLVTIEDLLEELVGEIWDEEDIVDNNFVKLGGNRAEVNTHITLGEICKRFSIECSEPISSERPILSLIFEKIGRIPEKEDSFVIGKLEFTVEEVEDSRIDTVIVRLMSDEDLELLKQQEATSMGGESR